MRGPLLSWLAAALHTSIASAALIPAQTHQQLRKRYDLNGDGIPDLCNVDKGTATCLLPNGQWTAFPANSPPTLTPSTAKATTTNTHAPTTTPTPLKTPIKFPTVEQWNAGNGTLWKVEYVGDLKFTDTLQTKGLGGDKCRTGMIGDKVIWSCGDMECKDSPTTNCGFSMGPAFYGTDDVMTVNTNGIDDVGHNTFATAWEHDPAPVSPQTAFGMDTSNVVEINATHGVAYVWEIWRGAPDSSIVDRGTGVVSVTLGATQPIASRVGPLLGDGKSLQLGLIAIMRANGHIYIYSAGGPSNVNVARVTASDDVFDASKYEFLVQSTQTWERPGAIPAAGQTRYGLKTLEPSGKFACLVYGSAFWNAAWNKYVILCNEYMSVTMFYVADAPEGPWSGTYTVLGGWRGYGSHSHAHYGVNPLYFSLGPDGAFNMFRLTINL